MKLTNKETNYIFNNIHIPEVFMKKYYFKMPAETVKVYLYFVYLEQMNDELILKKEFSIQDIADKTNILPKHVKQILQYLIEIKLLIYTPDGYIVTNLQEKELKELYNPRMQANKEEILKENSDSKYKEIIDTIESQFFSANGMNSQWYKQIIYWFNKYQFEDMVMLAIFAKCFSTGAKPVKYVETVAQAMFDKGIRTYADFEKSTKNDTKLRNMIKFLKSELNIQKNLTKPQERIVERWVIEYGYNKDVIKYLIEKTINKDNVGFAYLDKIAKHWHEQNLKKLKDIEEYENMTKEERKKKLDKKTEKIAVNKKDKTREERNFKDLDKLLL